MAVEQIIMAASEIVINIVAWESGRQYDTGSFTSVSLDHQGNCLETHVGSDRLFYRLGKLDIETKSVIWGESREYDTGSFTSVSLDHQGNCLETHVSSDRLFYRLGKLDIETKSVIWGETQQQNTGSATSITCDPQGNCLETYREGNLLYYRLGNYKPIVDVIEAVVTSPPIAETSPYLQTVLIFNGQDMYIDLGKKPEFKIARQITLEAWINCQAQRRRTGIITNIFDTNETESGYGLLLDGKSGIFFGLKTPSKRIQYLSSKENSIQFNHWHHIAGTYDGKRMRVYVDGVEKATKALTDNSIDYNPENNLVIGIYKDNNEAYPFKGQIAEVRIWNKVRSQTEIQADMNRCLVGNEPRLVGYWPLNDEIGTIVQDKTNNANHGHIVEDFVGVQTEISIEMPAPLTPPDDQNVTSTQPQTLEVTQETTQSPMEEQTSVITSEKPKSTKAKQQQTKEQAVKYPYKILSIDGGGIRGIIPAIILQEIENRTNKPIASLFDLIAGTSTGGILALGLTKPKLQLANQDNVLGLPEPVYTAKDLVSIFSEYGNVIFYEPLYAELLGDLDEILKPKYTSEGRDEILTQYFGSTTLSAALTEVLITSYDIEQRIPVLFTSNFSKENIESRRLRKIGQGFTMKEAAMATSAAPTYFVPYRIPTTHNRNGFYTLIDGGVFANNPTGLAVVESIVSAKKAKERGEEPWTLDNTLVLSLGTGSLTKEYPYYAAKNWGLVGWARPMFNIVLDGVSEAISIQIEELLPHSEDKSQQQYYRLQAYLDESLEPMDNIKSYNIRTLIQIAKQIIEEKTEEIDDLCQKLLN
ncbi:patatin-like phospholipase family protein [Nostoc linckia FACHB-104]|nr:patatin-like phospholipase family protein [Nostoc linckia FACHB-104]